MRLPTYQELSKEQLEIFNLPLEGAYLVTGPPGSGKTVMALYRAQILDDIGIEPEVIMYNNTLEEYTTDASQELEISGHVNTFHSWFWNGYPEWTGDGYPPEVEKYVYMWEEILPELIETESTKVGTLLVDEGQDLPTGFYAALQFITGEFTIFADENQRMDEEVNSTLDQIREATELDDELSLTKNYRNTREIARLAREFYVGLETGKPELPDRRGEKPVVRSTKSPEEAARFIAEHERTNDHEQIGVLVKNTDTQLRIHRLLKEDLETENEVQIYSSRSSVEDYMDFTSPGIKVLCFASSKGLEFDTVFLPEIQTFTSDLEDPSTKMELYVILSRARDRLFILFSGDDRPPILELFPDDLIEFRG